MQKPGQDHFWSLNCYLLTDFQSFCGTSYEFWNAIRMTRSYFYGGVSEHVDMHKNMFPKDGVRIVVTFQLLGLSDEELPHIL